ncbi:MAG: hypothetical protein GEV05_19475 [Betaproteobacteria bacterium]|nr:hypothetical protein [Betaproteobacteria bacterium]
MRKPPPKRWVLIIAGCAIAAIVVERSLVLYESKYRQVTAAEAAARRCASAPAPVPPFDEDPAPLVAQPGGIDPLGLSSAIRRALEDCP